MDPRASLDASEKRKIFPLLKRVCLHKHASFVLAPGECIYDTYWELNTLEKYHWGHYTEVTYIMKGKYIMILSTWICHCRISHLTQFVFSVDKSSHMTYLGSNPFLLLYSICSPFYYQFTFYACLQLSCCSLFALNKT